MVTTITARASRPPSISREERAAITSEEAFQMLGENLENHVEAGIHQIPSFLEKAGLAAEDSDSPPEEAGRGLGQGAYVGELVVHPEADPVDLYRICDGLKGRLKAELLSIVPSKEGTVIRCTVADPVKLLALLGKLGTLVAWSLVPQPAAAGAGIGD